uniref:Uncharacterized protein n=1 Tax=Panagrolaimus sp. JU765 TaxID=591449 RepID=A0AC34RH43_9BILA
MVSEGAFYLTYDCECKLGWNRKKEYYPNLTDGCSIMFSQFARDVFKFKIENISECIKKIFVSTKDFVQLFMDRRQFVFDFMDFLIKNHGTNNMILVVNAGATANNTENEEIEENYCSKMIAAFEEKYADLFKPEDLKYPSSIINFEDDQSQVPCSMIFFSNSGKIEIKNILMKEIKWYFTAETSYDKCFRSVDVTDTTDDPAEETEDDRFDILAEQIFQLYWLKKLVKNEINYLNFKNSKFSIMSSENIQKRSKKLKVYNHDIKKLWDQTISRCSELLEGSTKTESDLFAELSPHYLLALRNEFVSGSAFQAGDLSINEQISKLKLLPDESDFDSDSQNESSDGKINCRCQ